MSVLVYQLAHSPFCIPVTAALYSCGVSFEKREVPNWDRSEIIRLTNGAYYQVPLLVHDGKPVFESAVDSQDIPRYVDVSFRLVDPFYLDSITDLAERTMVLRHKERKFGRGCEEAWRREAKALRAEADRLLGRFEATLQYTPFLFGDTPVYADYLLYGVIGNMTWKGWNKLSEKQSALRAWVERVKEFRF
jgi:glutathione S-transferase